MRRLWREQAVDYDGRYYHLRDARVVPKPVQDGGPPIWVGGSGEWSTDCAARVGDAWFPGFISPRRYRDSWQHLTDLASSVGRDPAEITPACATPFFCAHTFEGAWPVVADYRKAEFGTTHEPDALAVLCALGSLQQCQDSIIKFAEAGVRNFVATMMCPAEHMLDQLAYVAEVVKPLQARP